ncbi:MAG: hypothetical protein HY270_19850 [Deltaproteobacteria bacterium]|nr:hypothetical protein [Deltaproteobacteria bacterium]
MRACNGVILMPAEKAAAFDGALRLFLQQQHPEPLRIPHRIYAILARRS